MRALSTSLTGLSSSQAHEHLKIHGLNTFTTVKKTSDVVEFLNNFTEPLIVVLIIIAVISLGMGEMMNGAIIGVMVCLSVTLNYLQEHKAGKAAQKLQEKVALQVTVRRDGREQNIPASHLVPEDIVLLNAGDLISADATILTAKHFFVNESALTGESLPVEKVAVALPDLPDSYRSGSSRVYAGTSVATGSAEALVVSTGMKTQFSHIVASLSKSETDNDFVAGIHSFSQMLVKVILVLVVILFAISTLGKHDLFTSFSFAIAVGVGLTPEFLPMILSVTMGKGALLLSQKGIIVKKLTAIPAFGSMDVLCTDKTGTLTEDKIRLVRYTDFHGRSSDTVLTYAYLNSCLESGITNPLDEAVKSYKHLDIKEYVKVDELPFDFNRRKLSIVVDRHNHHLMITKGAPETIISGCNTLEVGDKTVALTPAYKERLNNEYARLSREGYRVLGISTKLFPPSKKAFTLADELQSSFVGFTSFLDPVKPRIKEAIDSLEAIGIEIKVISGDNELVCKKICEEADIPIKGILLGSKVDSMNDAVLSEQLKYTSICARFSPVQKDRVIALLRQSGHVVGYMGDGINDAPSLKTADVGISVNNAVDVAKEAADLIMTHKSLADLVEGVIAGRTIFGNTMKYLQMGLSSNFGNMLSMLGAVILLPFLPMTPLQLLLNNFLYDFAQITIPTDRVDADYVSRPKRWNLPFIQRFMLTLGPVSTLFDFIGFYFLYHWFKGNPAGFQTGWFMLSLATQVLVIHIIRTQKIPFFQSTGSPTLIYSTILLVILGWTIPYTPLGRLFSLVPIPVSLLPIFMVIIAAYLLLTQFFKKYTYSSAQSC